MYKQVLSLIVATIFALVLFNCSGEKEGNNPVSSRDQLLVQETAGVSDMGRMGIFSDVLNLTAEQQEQIETIIEQQRENYRESRGERKSRPSWEERKAMRQERYDALVKEIMPILTSEQQAMVTEMKAAFDRGEVPAVLINKRVEKLGQELNLTSEQQEQIKSLFAENGKKMLALRENSADRKTFREAMKNLRSEGDAQLQAILTPDQQAAYARLKAQRKEKMKERFQKSRHQSGEQRMEKRVEQLTTELSLTNEQQTQLRAIFTNAHKDMSKEMQSGNTDRETRRELFRQHFDKVDAQIRGILNETQLQKYETLRAEMRQQKNEHFKED